MASPKRSTFRLDRDVRGYLEKISNKYRGMNMTTAVHIMVRHCKEKQVVENLLQRKTQKKDEAPNVDPNGETKDTGVDNESTAKSSGKESNGSVRFDNMARDEKEKKQGQNDDTRGQDESGGNESGSSEKDTKKEGSSAASSIRSKFRG